MFNSLPFLALPSQELLSQHVKKAFTIRSMNIGLWVKAARKSAGWTQTKLGDAVGRTKANVGHWETGKHEPSFDQMVAISVATKYPMPVTEALQNTTPYSKGTPTAPAIATEPAKTYVLDRAWPFETVPRDLWDSLTERQKGEIEFQIKHLAGVASGYVQQDKAQKMAY